MQGVQDQESEDLSQLSRTAWHGAEVFQAVDCQDLAALVEGVDDQGRFRLPVLGLDQGR